MARKNTVGEAKTSGTSDSVQETGGNIIDKAIRRGRDVGTEMRKGELEYLYNLALLAPDGPACEVGSLHGGSVITWAHARFGRGKIRTIDIRKPKELVENLKNYPIEIVTGVSWEIDLEPQAFVFIDGDHTKKGVSRDIAAYTKKMIPGGIIAFHDYRKGLFGVYDAVKKWRKKAQWERVGRVNTIIAFRCP